ncbi:protein MIS12 homolog [Rhineura floridana]|uniref:protein MIS12 homolog n=1 Tax=Rhineura floridana TaxID=261503 RepID=UPI002AC87470|nr:protein MIS12 homolog [Rhineura floridana]XP_061461176.1 protein MIS12 homolog [Rhineura floridana]XP_061461177.1 protein MIS12 homolog [Rhineura floridana]XP_061461178.1 protein MIS12 homolog [Rhineura floridana]XP_061461179.1 protein MIS12 homolog [Rhineura floridana]
MSVNPMVYETQFFGFTPETFMLRIHVAFQDHLAHMMLLVEDAILNKLESIRPNKLTPSLIRRSTEQFLSLMKNRFNSLFGKMQDTLLNAVLRIPKNVLLPEDKAQEEFCYTVEEFQRLQNEINQLERRLKAEASAERALHAELEEQKGVQAHLEGILQWFDSLNNIGREEGASNLKESLSASLKTAVELQSIMREVEEKMNKLGEMTV